jgi:cytochrome P450
MEMREEINVLRKSVSVADPPFLNILDPGFDYALPEVGKAREQSWYAKTPLGIIVLRHREGDEILRDPRFRLGGENYPQTLGISEGPLFDWWMGTLMSAGVEDHARLRGLVAKAFTPRIVEKLRPFVRKTAAQLADQIHEGEVCEFVSAFAEPFPARVMCEMLGVPIGDYETFHQCSQDIALAFSRNLEGLLPRVEAAITKLSEYVDSLLTQRRSHLGDDLISSLIRSEESGDRLSHPELHNLVLLLVWAGQDTPARQLGLGLVAFAEHPEQWMLLSQRPELAPQAVEEICRWYPQTRPLMRYPLHDLEYQGLHIPAGTMVMICTDSVNRDPRAFDDAERFDVTVPRKARQLVFGGGMHSCLGASAARLEMAEGLAVLAQRLGPPTIAGPIKWRPSVAMIYGPDVLPLRFGAQGKIR